MLVTLFGIVVFLQPAIKVFDAISIIALQLLRESYFVFPVSTFIDVRPSHQPKTAMPMLVTLFGMVTEVRPLQLQYLQVVSYQIFARKTIEK